MTPGAPVFENHDPVTGASRESLAPHTPAQVAARLEALAEAQEAWARVPLVDRAGHLRALASALRDRKDTLARTMTREMGKPLAQSEGEVEKSAWVCEHYADEAGAYLASRIIEAKADESVIVPRPLGGVLAIMPWNFPVWQVLRFAAPALMAGNAVLVKHAPSTMATSDAIVAAARAAGLPAGLFEDVRVPVEGVPELIAHPAIAAVTVTGSERAGRAVAAEAGRHLKKTVLELGGSDPFIVLEDADLAKAVQAGTASRCLNNGQSCIAAKRFIVVDAVADEFVRRLTQAMAAQQVGDPMASGTQVGPLAREDLRDQLARQVADSVAAGAVVCTGGHAPARAGWFYTPTVLDAVPDGCPAADEELFGPVAAVFRVPDEDAAIARANRTAYGLSASLWTADRARARRLADRIQAGAVFVNDMSYSDPRLPFGGTRLSGYGRELGAAGILEFVNLQTRCFA
jgi:succinate-semialdehyde dehydrogenase / glutarate-semialdehyde dehydrogenase